MSLASNDQSLGSFLCVKHFISPIELTCTFYEFQKIYLTPSNIQQHTSLFDALVDNIILARKMLALYLILKGDFHEAFYCY